MSTLKFQACNQKGNREWIVIRKQQYKDQVLALGVVKVIGNWSEYNYADLGFSSFNGWSVDIVELKEIAVFIGSNPQN